MAFAPPAYQQVGKAAARLCFLCPPGKTEPMKPEGTQPRRETVSVSFRVPREYWNEVCAIADQEHEVHAVVLRRLVRVGLAHEARPRSAQQTLP